MIKIIKEFSTKEEEKTSIYIGRGSPFGNYSFSNKKSQNDLPSMPFKKGIKLFHQDFKENLEYHPKLKREFDKIVKKIINGEDIILKCYCINKNINNINDIDLNKIKCHGEIISLEIYKEVEKRINQNINNSIDDNINFNM